VNLVLPAATPRTRIRLLRVQFDVRKARPGDAYWSCDERGRPTTLLIACPGACGQLIIVPLAHTTRWTKTWEWDGRIVRPTFYELIDHICGWSGRLLSGEFHTETPNERQDIHEAE